MNIFSYFQRKSKEKLYKQWVNEGDLPFEELPADLVKEPKMEEVDLPEGVSRIESRGETKGIHIGKGMIRLPIRYMVILLIITVSLLVAFSVILTIFLTRS